MLLSQEIKICWIVIVSQGYVEKKGVKNLCILYIGTKLYILYYITILLYMDKNYTIMRCLYDINMW